GHVVDFILVHWQNRWYFPAFNIADSAITVGAVMLALDMFKGNKTGNPHMTEQRIGPGKEVTLHFSLGLETGELVDSTFDKKPATFQVGDCNLLPGFEQQLYGLKAGDKRTLQIAPEQGFGQVNPQNVQVMPRSQFAGMELSEGLMVSFQDAART
ncbi:FKBP-type peptidyl-prolyl cis-trans isomerase, partial [Citrobacter sp. VF227]